MNLEKQYEAIETGDKVKVVYVKKNQFGYETVSFLRWPPEFNKMVCIDMNKMIEKAFENKILTLLEPMGKEILLEDTGSLGAFFE